MNRDKPRKPVSITSAAGNRLTFVIFALLVLVVVPVCTSFLLSLYQDQLVALNQEARTHLINLRASLQPKPNQTPLHPSASDLDAALAEMSREQDNVRARIDRLSAMQFQLPLVLGALGLLACAYTRSALRHLRRNVTDLDAQRQKLAAIFDTANTGILLWDASGTLLDANPAALQLLGEETLESAQRRIEQAGWAVGGLDLRSADGDSMPRDAWPTIRAARGETFDDLEVRLTRPDDTYVWARVSGCPAERAPNGTLLSSVTVFQDITARRESERRMRELAQADAHRAHVLESLFETASQLAVNAAPEAMHEHLTAQVASALHVQKAALWTYEEARSVLTPLLPACGFNGDLPAGLTVPVRRGEWMHALLFQNETVLSNDLASDAGAQPYAELISRLSVHSLLAVPLIAHGRPVGVLVVNDKQPPAPFTWEDVRLLRTFAGQAAFVLHSSRLYARTLARSAELATLAHLTAVLNGSLDLRAILAAFLREARPLFAFDRAHLALRPSRKPENEWITEEPADAAETTETPPAYLEIWTADAQSDETEPTTHLLSETGLLGWVVTHGEPLYVADTQSPASITRQAGYNTFHKNEAESALGIGEGVRSILVIPLTAGDVVLGALQLDCNLPHGFGGTQMDLARQIAGQLAAAAQNARLYEEATHRAEQLEWAMQETHHRIKNNLQAVSAILDIYLMEGNRDQEGRSRPMEALAHALQEIRTIAAVHDLLSEDTRISRVNVRQLMERLVSMLASGSTALGKHIDFDVRADDVMVPSKVASALALATNELVVNAIEHGGRQRDAVEVQVALHYRDNALCLTVSDDGPGFPPDYDRRSDANIGLNLAQTLIVRDHCGTLEIHNDHGAHVEACIPCKEGRKYP